MPIRTLIEQPDGSITGVDRARLQEMPFYLLTNPPLNILTIPANSSSQQVELGVGQGGPAEITDLTVEASGAANVLFSIVDGEFDQWNRRLMNSAIDIRTIMGAQGLCYRLPESLIIGEGRALTASFSNLTAAPITVRMAAKVVRYSSIKRAESLLGIRERLRRRQYLSMPFWYTTDAGPITCNTAGLAGDTQQAVITIDRDMHFSLHTLTALTTFPDWDIDIVDVLTGASIIRAHQQPNYPISANLCVGTPGFPFKLHEPRLYLAKTKLVVTLVNRSALGPNIIRLTLGGTSQMARPWA